MVRSLIALQSLRGIGPITARRLLHHFGGWERILAAVRGTQPEQLKLSHSALSALCSAKETDKAWTAAREVLRQCRDREIAVVPALGDGRHPWEPTGYTMPTHLFLRGRVSLLHHPRRIGVIGTRDPTTKGLDRTRRITRRLCRRGCLVVSGLARGVDTTAHETALANEGVTAACIAHGPEMILPKQNTPLGEAIFTVGCLVSEYPPGTEVQPYMFVQRDRILAAWCHGVIVVESDLDGGAMITADFAARAGRPLACPPSADPPSRRERGPARLAERGAEVLRTPDDLDRWLDRLFPGGLTA